MRRRTLASPAFAPGRGGRAGRVYGLEEVEAFEKDESEAPTSTIGMEISTTGEQDDQVLDERRQRAYAKALLDVSPPANSARLLA